MVLNVYKTHHSNTFTLVTSKSRF